MSGDAVKSAVVVGAVATGVGFFAGTLGTGPLASALVNRGISAGLATFLASAGTTLTYKFQAANQIGANTFKIGYGDAVGGSSASITLMEIAQ